MGLSSVSVIGAQTTLWHCTNFQSKPAWKKSTYSVRQTRKRAFYCMPSSPGYKKMLDFQNSVISKGKR